MRTIYKIATEANGMSRKSSAGKSLWHNEKQFDRLSKLLASMTSIECGIPLQYVHTDAICEGYLLAFPENKEALTEWFKAEDEYWNW